MKGTNPSALLIYPRYHYRLASSLEEPLGLLYVASALKNAGVGVDVVDLTFDKDLSRVSAGLEKRPSWVGMSVTSPLLDKALEVLQFVRRQAPDTPVVVGGPHASAFPDGALTSGFDYAVVGDGEGAAVEFTEGIELGDVSGVSGLVYRCPTDDGLCRNPPLYTPDLDSLPYPDRSYLDYRKYEKVGCITTRGCPYNCFYCKPMQDKLFGRKIRRRSPENVVGEIEEVVRTLGRRMIHFRDDTITIGGLEWFQSFERLLRERVPGGIQFQCNSRVDQVSEEKLALMKRAGCSQIFFGVESGSQKILDFYRKGTRPEQAVEAFRLCKKYRIQTVAAIMLGAPVETVEDMKLTYKLVRRIKPDNWIVYTTTPFPGNYLYDYAVQNKLMRVSRSEEFDNAMNKRNGFMPLQLENITPEDLRRYTNKIDRYMLFYSLVKFRTLFKVLRRPRSAYYKVMNLLRLDRVLGRIRWRALKPAPVALGVATPAEKPAVTG